MYYTDLIDGHELMPHFGGLPSGNTDTFIWNDLACSGQCAARGFLKLVIRPHRATMHFWQRGASMGATNPLGVLLIHNSIATHLLTEHFDGVVLTAREAALVKRVVDPHTYAQILPRLHVVQDSFFAGGTQEAAEKLLGLANAKRWASVATTFFGGDDALMDTVYAWRPAYPSMVNVFYTQHDAFNDIRDGFYEIAARTELGAR